ncbi:MAG: zinc ribbon domain-containing protein [Acidobacteriota bacterium]|nr:zinc ribbon domain-containing protein [Acidobacteriota bacterium]
MQCRNCGTEIADKAIVCYRCGTGTTDPVRSPAPIRRRGGAGPSLVAAMAPLLLAVAILLMAPSSDYPEAMRAAAAVSALAGVALLITRLLRRR